MNHNKYFKGLNYDNNKNEKEEDKFLIISTLIYEIVEIVLDNRNLDLKSFSENYLKNSLNMLFLEDLIRNFIEKNEILKNEFSNNELLINLIGLIIIEIIYNLIENKKIIYKDFIIKNIISFYISKNI